MEVFQAEHQEPFFNAIKDVLAELEAALREVFVKMMTLVDEEDAAFLVRVTRLAESSPLLQEATDQVSGLWAGATPVSALTRLCGALHAGPHQGC